MHPVVMDAIHAQVKEIRKPPKRVLEVGGLVGPKSLLNFPELAGAQRYSLNLVAMPSQDGITAIQGDGNDLSMFANNSFDLVMCNATLEHDKFFWFTIAEMKRVLKPRGTLIIGVPGFQRDEEKDVGHATTTFRVHTEHDYYRFSEQAIREVFLDGLVSIQVQPIMDPVRLIGRGRKPVPPKQPQSKSGLGTRLRRALRRALAALARRL